MKKFIIPISMGLMSVSFTIVPPVSKESPSSRLQVSINASEFSNVDQNAACDVYITAGLEEKGLSENAFKQAWKGYHHLLNKNRIGITNYLTICDFSKSSRQKRLYLIDVLSKKLVKHTYVAHGRNTGYEYATSFSNKPESLQSSLGFYITLQTYIGENGLSLRLNGVDNGFNNNALSRNIVMHGADYIGEGRAAIGMNGRSYGCPSVPKNEAPQIIHTIKNGTCLFIYYPDKHYGAVSKILNG